MKAYVPGWPWTAVGFFPRNLPPRLLAKRSCLDDMAAGSVTREAVEALRAVYPAVYADVRERLVQRLASHGSALEPPRPERGQGVRGRSAGQRPAPQSAVRPLNA